MNSSCPAPPIPQPWGACSTAGPIPNGQAHGSGDGLVGPAGPLPACC